jgi:hypothetical protein
MLLLISITEHADDIEHSPLGCGDPAILCVGPTDSPWQAICEIVLGRRDAHAPTARCRLQRLPKSKELASCLASSCMTVFFLAV